MVSTTTIGERNIDFKFQINKNMFKTTTQKILLSLLFFFFSYSTLLAQEQDSLLINYSKFIDESDMKKHLSVLASDEYEGRETGQKGQKMAAEYIANHFKELGLIAPLSNGNENSYLQRFELHKKTLSEFRIETLTGKIELSQNEIIVVTPFREDKNEQEYDIIFAGYGLEEEGKNGYSSYNSIDVEDKIVVILIGMPQGKENLIPNEEARKSVYLQMNFKAKLAKAKGAKGIVFVVKKADYTLFNDMYGHYFKDPKWQVPLNKGKEDNPDFMMALSTTDRLPNILGYTDRKWKKVFKKWNKKNETVLEGKANVFSRTDIEEVETENVLGYLEGTDKREELIVITAHYDHIGIIDGKVYNGADDDGSGTTAVLELAEAFSLAKREGHAPRRSILFMLVTGEEKGLLGSSYYSENPVFPLKNTVSNLNIDMIGRIDKAHEGNPNYVYIIGSTMLSTELHNLSEFSAKTYSPNMELDYTYNDKDDPNRFYYRSDHYNFAKHDIPVIFYFNGVHDDYHQHTDEVDKIHFGKMQEITRLVFATAWNLVNKEERIKND